MLFLSLLLPMLSFATISNLSECSTKGWDLSRLPSAESFELVPRDHLGGCDAKMRIEPGDDAINEGLRAEIKDPRYLRAGAITTHKFLVFVPARTLGATKRLVLAQWHDAKLRGVDAQRPPLSMRLEGSRIIFPFFNQKIWEKNPNGPGRNLVSIPAKFNRWITVQVKARWAADKTGRIQIWIDGKVAANYKGPVGYEEDVYSPYFKMGVYTVHPLLKPASAYFSSYNRSVL